MNTFSFLCTITILKEGIINMAKEEFDLIRMCKKLYIISYKHYNELFY